MKNLKVEVTRYFIDKDGAIKITHIKLSEADTGKYIRFAKLNKILPYLSQLEVTWKPQEDGKK